MVQEINKFGHCSNIYFEYDDCIPTMWSLKRLVIQCKTTRTKLFVSFSNKSNNVIMTNEILKSTEIFIPSSASMLIFIGGNVNISVYEKKTIQPTVLLRLKFLKLDTSHYYFVPYFYTTTYNA